MEIAEDRRLPAPTGCPRQNLILLEHHERRSFYHPVHSIGADFALVIPFTISILKLPGLVTFPATVWFALGANRLIS